MHRNEATLGSIYRSCGSRKRRHLLITETDSLSSPTAFSSKDLGMIITENLSLGQQRNHLLQQKGSEPRRGARTYPELHSQKEKVGLLLKDGLVSKNTAVWTPSYSNLHSSQCEKPMLAYLNRQHLRECPHTAALKKPRFRARHSVF